MAALSIGLAAIGVSAVAILAYTGVGPSPGNNALEALGLVLFMGFIIGAALSTWIANFLRSKVMRR
jgi:hypothetical protein